MLLSSTAPLPNNSLTPLPQSWADARNARIGMLTLLTNRAKSITDCYAPAASFLSDAGPIVAAQVAQAQANMSNATIASGTTDGTPNAASSGDTSSNAPAPVVLPLNSVALGTVGGSMMPAESSCHPGRRAIIPQPRMMMPQPAPAIVNTTPSYALGMSGIAPPWGSYSRQSQNSGGSIDWLATICSHPVAAILISAGIGWALTQMAKKGRG
jgi:hypothetical protein